MTSSRRVAAVVVTWNPGVGFTARMSRVVNQVGAVVIVDNGSRADDLGRLRTLAGPNVCLVEGGENLGVGRALNVGVGRVLERETQWVLTLDQDTEVDEDLVSALLRIHEEASSCSGPVGLLGANARSRISGVPMFRCRPGTEFLEPAATITSGSLLCARAYRRVGPFREDFFIEGIDVEYCMRLRSQGYRILVSSRPLMTHAAGQGQERSLFGRTVVIPNHPAWRHYHQGRNLTFVVLTYMVREGRAVMRLMGNMMKSLAKTALLEERGVAKLRWYAAGVADGIALYVRGRRDGSRIGGGTPGPMRPG